MTKVGRPDETGIQLPVCFAHDLVAQIRSGFFTVCGKVQIQSQNVRRLRAAGDAAARCDEFFPDRIADLVCKRLQLCLRFGIAQRVCCLGCQRNRVQIIAAGNQRFRRLTEFDCFRRVKREPVAKLESIVPEVITSIAGADIPAPVQHGGILPAKLGQIAGMQIEIPRDDRCGIAPSGKASVHSSVITFANKCGNGNGHMAVRVFLLFPAQVIQEFLPKGCAVPRKERRAAENLRIAGPAEAFIALRTVGRQIDEVSALTPFDVFNQTVQIRIGGAQRTGLRHFAVKNERRKCIGRKLGIGSEPDIAEAVIGEFRHDRLRFAV